MDKTPNSAKPRRKYDEDFKNEAVRLVITRQLSVPDVAISLGISENILYHWKGHTNKVDSSPNGIYQEDYDQLRGATAPNRTRAPDARREILKKALFQPHDLTLSYQLFTQLRADFPVERLCKTLGISRSAYYAYQAGQSYRLTEGKEKLRQAMLGSFGHHRRRYGSPEPPMPSIADRATGAGI